MIRQYYYKLKFLYFVEYYFEFQYLYLLFLLIHQFDYFFLLILSYILPFLFAVLLIAYLIPLLKPEGEALIYRGKWNESDQKRLNIALEKLNARTKIIQHMELPEGKGERNIIRIYPIKACSNKYPRAIGIPIKKPLAS